MADEEVVVKKRGRPTKYKDQKKDVYEEEKGELETSFSQEFPEELGSPRDEKFMLLAEDGNFFDYTPVGMSHLRNYAREIRLTDMKFKRVPYSFYKSKAF